MEKRCIFCGEPPVDKNKEHVMPQWLIKMTGDPKRITTIGQLNGSAIRFPWLNYVFPACEKCNTEFAAIEGQAKVVLEYILEEKMLTHPQMNLFLDWLDKIRVGIWLGQAMLYKSDLTPNFYIKERVGAKDRLCILYRLNDGQKGIGLIGTETAIFQDTPSCFGLVINDLAIFSYSKEFLLGKNLGFPFPEQYFYDGSMGVKAPALNHGKFRVAQPILDGKIFKPAIKFYQSILKIKHEIKRPTIGVGRKYFNENCDSFNADKIVSRILVSLEVPSYQRFWQREKKERFRFAEKFDRKPFVLALTKMVLEHQIHSIAMVLENLDIEDDQKRQATVTYFNGIVAKNRSALQNIDEVLGPIIEYI